jgi:hypothetical protein
MFDAPRCAFSTAVHMVGSYRCLQHQRRERLPRIHWPTGGLQMEAVGNPLTRERPIASSTPCTAQDAHIFSRREPEPATGVIRLRW